VPGCRRVMGVLRPRIVLPADFLQRYDAAERALIVRHERLHIVRGDLQCNAAAALLRCVYWFNPVLHMGLRCYRHDQELACDARVLADHPASRRRYGQAMLKTQLDASPLPVGCHWHTHPIKERIAMLKHPAPRRWQKILSMLLLPVVLCGGGYAAWAKQPASAGPQAGAAMEASSALATNQAPGPSAGRADVFQGNVRLDMPPRGREPVDVARLPPASQGATAQRTPAPAYPREAAKRQVQGRVVVLVDVAPDGSVSGATVETSEPAGVFDAVTLAAVRTWTFRPARQNGVPVAGRVRVPVDFSLGKPAKDAARPPRLTGWFSESLHDDPARPQLASLQCDRLVVHHDADGAPSQTECGIDAR
jgi:TonB family protein